jgi:hypothetical protein
MSGPHQPLGIGTYDLRTAKKDRTKVIEEAEADFRRAVMEAGTLYEALKTNPALKVVVEMLEQRIDKFLKTDEQCQAGLKILASWKFIMVDGPRYAEDKMKRVLGPELHAVKEETQAAP